MSELLELLEIAFDLHWIRVRAISPHMLSLPNSTLFNLAQTGSVIDLFVIDALR